MNTAVLLADPITMNTGKLAPLNDPRMPSKAPEVAPDSTHKPMPEFPIDPEELKYPPDDQLSGHHDPKPGSRPNAPLEARSEVPRRMPPLIPAAVKAALEATTVCALACERTAHTLTDHAHGAHHQALARLCAATCRLAHDFLENATDPALAVLIRDVCAACARTCEACAAQCELHPNDAVMVAGAQACRTCASACRAVTA